MGDLVISASIDIFDRPAFNRAVRKQVARCKESGYFTQFTPRDVAGIAIKRVLDENPDLWQFSMVNTVSKPSNFLKGYLSQDAQARIAEVLT